MRRGLDRPRVAHRFYRPIRGDSKARRRSRRPEADARRAMDVNLLWIPATLIASAGQVARNVMQRRLVETIGTVGATQVRFLYGFPFALVFLGAVLVGTGEALPRPGPLFWPFLLLGAATQIAATA
jgi:hypothetical protein